MKGSSRIVSIIIAAMLMINLAGAEVLAAEMPNNGEIESNITPDKKPDSSDDRTLTDGLESDSNKADNSDTRSSEESTDAEESADTKELTDAEELTDTEKKAEISEEGAEETFADSTYISDLEAVAQEDTAKFTWSIEDQENAVSGFDIALYTTADLQEDTKAFEGAVEKESEDQEDAEATVDGLETGVMYYAALTPYSLNENGEKEEAKTSVIEIMALASPTLSAAVSEGTVTLKWSKVDGAERYEVYQIAGTGKTLLATIKGNTSYTHKVSKNNVTYQYVVTAVSANAESAQSNPVSAKPRTVVPGKVTNLSGMDGEKCAALTWSKAANATSYYVYRYNSSKKKWTLIKNTTKTSYTDKSLKAGKTYKYRIAAVRTQLGESAVGSTTSTLSVSVKKTPGKKVYPMKYKATIKSKAPCFKSKNGKKAVKYLKKGTRVTTINSGNGRYQIKLSNGKTYWVAKGRLKITASVWTTKDYSTQTKTNFVNSRGYKSPTKYLIWISQYTQRVMIYEGKKGKWKLIRNCRCATGTHLHKTPKGTFKITYKEKGWFYRTTYEKPIVHFKGANSFHSRIKNYKGGYADATIGRPKSKGCVRLYDKDINFIYKKCPKGTTVVSY